MSVWLVTRHGAAREWLAQLGFESAELVESLALHDVKSGDVVVGTLPVQLIAQVCAQGATYWHLVMDVPAHLRGQELTAQQMTECGARIEPFEARLLNAQRGAGTKPVLVLVETLGNQAYVFRSNRLREMAGASQLILEATTTWVVEQVRRICPSHPLAQSADILDDTKNPPWSSHSVVEYLLLSSGKSLLIVDSEENARAIVAGLTFRALQDAPGLDVCAAWVPFDRDAFDLSAEDVHHILATLHRDAFEKARQSLAAARLRFPMAPPFVRCQSTGLPAAAQTKVGNDTRLLSAESRSKRSAYSRWLARWRGVAADVESLAAHESIDDLGWERLGVLHADGNGLGQVFLDYLSLLRKTTESPTGRDYLNSLRRFSAELGNVVSEAVLDAVPQTNAESVSMVPLILGGDDVTALVRGSLAIETVCELLTQLRRKSSDEARFPELTKITKAAFGKGGVDAGAGLAIVSTHFPFHSAYRLSEELCRSAKEVKLHGGGSSFDVHVVHDSTFVGLAEVRAQLHVGNARLYRRPFLINADSTGAASDPWRHGRSVNNLRKRQSTLRQRDPETGRRVVSMSALSEIRAAMGEGREAADARFALMLGAASGQARAALMALAEADSSLFAEDQSTSVLDAIELLPYCSQATATGGEGA